MKVGTALTQDYWSFEHCVFSRMAQSKRITWSGRGTPLPLFSEMPVKVEEEAVDSVCSWCSSSPWLEIPVCLFNIAGL